MNFRNKFVAHFRTEHPNSGRYLKFDEIYVSANTCACSRFRRALILLLALRQIFCLWRLKLILLSRVIPRSLTVSDTVILFLLKHVFFSMFLYFEYYIT